MFDTHTHLNHPELLKRLDAEIQDIKKAGVNYLLVPGYDLASSKQALEITKQDPDIYCSIGIHPYDVVKNYYQFAKHQKIEAQRVSQFIDYLKQELTKLLSLGGAKIKAIGEIGLDFHWNKESEERELQLTVFRALIAFAISVKLPVIVHSRDAGEETYNIIKEYTAQTSFIMHCYSYDEIMVQQFLSLDCYIAVGGVITYKSAALLKQAILKVPLKRLLLETDAPYLTPMPFRGQTNSSKYLPLIVTALSTLLNRPETVIKQETTTNAKRVFKISS
ncbi:MAG: TatD family hydrolase [Erysipelotrichaceae bacterium]|jgi:TatD DNase family protein|nr:TatD family hydrolase [Erysipelotrichaceae bacterium]